ncbi:MAG TPA: 3-phosphoshikimate 1-carboxyvinyltransferase [Solirubrobacterales bacterium]|nr:3-phosphoshikimate 1-carboxyvinyltransferase [Solirubrobacterales bacterium]
MRFDPSGPLHGDLNPPPDKSVSHRAALIGAMAEGPTRITGYLDSADTRATLRAISAVGADVREGEADEHGGFFVEIEGIGLRGPRPASIDVGNAGTLLRLMPGWLAGQREGEWTLDGDKSIRRRPVDRIAEPLRRMGAEVEAREERLPPLLVRGAALRGIDYEMPVASAQVKSCLLFAGLLAEGTTTVREPYWTRDHTERLLAAAGAEIRRDGSEITVAPTERLEAGDVPVPGDFSSAAFFIVAALIVPGSEVSLREVGINRARIGLLSILSRMGVEMGGAHEGDRAISVEEIREPGPEPIAKLNVRTAPLRGTEVTAEDVPSAIDELPLVALLGCFAEGETVVSGAAELRAKESDRIAGIVDGLVGLGAEIEARPDGFAVRGSGGLRGGSLDARGDHRLAMVGAVAGLASREGVEVRGFDAVEVSYPGFERDLRSLLG